MTMTNFLFFGITTFNPPHLPLIYTLPPRTTVILKPLQLTIIGKKKTHLQFRNKIYSNTLEVTKTKTSKFKEKKKRWFSQPGVVGGDYWWPNHPKGWTSHTLGGGPATPCDSRVVNPPPRAWPSHPQVPRVATPHGSFFWVSF